MDNIPALAIALTFCFLRINTRLSKYLLWFLLITVTPESWTIPYLPSQPTDYAGVESLLSSTPAILSADR